MSKQNKIGALFALIAAVVISVTGCTSSGTSSHVDAKAAQKHNQGKVDANDFNAQAVPPKIVNHTDYQNFFKSQELYDNPSTILWCTFTWGNANSPMVTVPVAGKLTSSSVALNPGVQTKVGGGGDGSWTDTYNPEVVSSDGMYHGSPPPYRYGFTPGGQYVDFFNTQTFCTTALTDFQRQKTVVQLSVDPAMQAAQAKAEAALAECNKNLKPADAGANVAASKCQAAQDALKQGLGG